MWQSIKQKLLFYKQEIESSRRKLQQSRTIDPASVQHLHPTISCHRKWYGSSYGGFYIHPDLLGKNSVIYSFGIGRDITFDLACIRYHQAQVYGFDPTPKSIDYIRSQSLPAAFHFYDFAVSPDVTKQIEFFLPAHPKGVSGSLVESGQVDAHNKISVLAKSFADIVAELGHTHLDVVKIDIEGSEYELIESILSHPVTIDQILIEFHDRFFEAANPRSNRTVGQLTDHGYQIFGHSINFEEVSFIKTSALR